MDETDPAPAADKAEDAGTARGAHAPRQGQELPAPEQVESTPLPEIPGDGVWVPV